MPFIPYFYNFRENKKQDEKTRTTSPKFLGVKIYQDVQIKILKIEFIQRLNVSEETVNRLY
ncbi:MAG: hypothetical protein ACJAT4_000775 [Granulosicoccus sp.]